MLAHQNRAEWTSVSWMIAFSISNLLGMTAIANGKPLGLGILFLVYPLQSWLAGQAFLAAAWLVFGQGGLLFRLGSLAGLAALSAGLVLALDNGTGARAFLGYAPAGAFLAGLLACGLIRAGGVQLVANVDRRLPSTAVTLLDFVRWLTLIAVAYGLGGQRHMDQFVTQIAVIDNATSRIVLPAMFTGILMVALGLYLAAFGLRRSTSGLSLAVEILVMAPVLSYALNGRMGLLSYLPGCIAIGAVVSHAMLRRIGMSSTFLARPASIPSHASLRSAGSR